MENLTKPSVKKVSYPNINTVRLDDSTQRELDVLAVYERKRLGTLLRDLIIDKVQEYVRNPTYNRFKKQLEERVKN